MQKLLLALALAACLPFTTGCVPMAAVGAGTVAVMAGDRRTAGMYVEDENIEWKILSITQDGKYAGTHVNATSYNRKVLLTGEAPNEDVKKQLGDAASKVPSVVEVTNELQVAGASSLAARGNDSLVTTNVKTRMVNNKKFSPNHIKVVTEASTVYLMGIVSQEEGDAAAEIARTTSGVRGVVKVFEYRKF
jgi:osmotically-inducible protein OsmY